MPPFHQLLSNYFMCSSVFCTPCYKKVEINAIRDLQMWADTHTLALWKTCICIYSSDILSSIITLSGLFLIVLVLKKARWVEGRRRNDLRSLHNKYIFSTYCTVTGNNFFVASFYPIVCKDSLGLNLAIFML